MAKRLFFPLQVYVLNHKVTVNEKLWKSSIEGELLSFYLFARSKMVLCSMSVVTSVSIII